MRGGGRSRAQVSTRVVRTRLVTLGLFVGTALSALVLAQVRHLGLAQTLVAVLVGGGAPAALYLGWATYRDGQLGDGVLSLEQVADQLAIAVRDQWEGEARIRRLNDPYPLPVCWGEADASLVDSWDGLEKLAVSGAGWGSRVGPWAGGPAALAGEGSQLVDVVGRIPTGRLVVLGEPGSGKTMLMVRLVLDLLSRRSAGEPVPVLTSIASWDPLNQDLHHWLESVLVVDHPGLAAPARDGSTHIRGLLREGIIMPILDGLDEIPDAVRGPAISKINDALRPAQGLVLTCRTAEYRDGVHPSDGPGITLRGAAGIELRALDLADVAEYLKADAGNTAGTNRWVPVLSSLEALSPLGQILSIPLMVSMARMIYNPRPGEHAGAVRNPTELCSLDDPAAIKNHLYSAFIPAAYRSRPSSHELPRPWSAQQAGPWLTFLASYLETTAGSPDIAWWQLIRAVPLMLYRIVAGLAAGLAVGCAIGYSTSLRYGFWLGLVAALCAAFLVRLDRLPLRGQVFRIRAGLPAALTIGLGSAFVFTFARTSYAKNALSPSIRIGFAVGLAFAVVAGVLAGTEQRPRDLELAPDPASVLADDRRTAIMVGLTTTTIFALGLSMPLLLNAAVYAGAYPARMQLPIWSWLPFAILAGIILGLLIKLISEFSQTIRSMRIVEQMGRYLAATVVVVVSGFGIWLTISAAVGLLASERFLNQGVFRLLGDTAGNMAAAFGGDFPYDIGFGLAIGAVVGFITGVQAAPQDLKAGVMLAAGREQGLSQTKISVGLLVAIVFAFAVGLITGQNAYSYGVGFWTSLGAAVGDGLPLGFGVWIGLQLVRTWAVWPLWLVTRVWLASRRQMPWRIMAFLADAHRRGVLRQVGAVYQFRHIELQQQLAAVRSTRTR